MDNKTFVPPDNIPADLDKSWHIPRPTLARSSNGSQGSTSSNNSTQSARSGSLLLNTANLAQIHHQQQNSSSKNDKMMSTRDLNIKYYLDKNNKEDAFPASLPKKTHESEPDNVSVASSTHFTVVNMSTRPSKVPKRSFCRKHQLTILVLSMSIIFTIGILMAICMMEMRARDQRRYS